MGLQELCVYLIILKNEKKQKDVFTYPNPGHSTKINFVNVTN